MGNHPIWLNWSENDIELPLAKGVQGCSILSSKSYGIAYFSA